MNRRQAFLTAIGVTEREKELIWEHISNRYSWHEIVNATERKQDQMISNAWQWIKKSDG